MDIQDVLRILKNGAEKPKDDLNDYIKGKRDGQVQAYSHAWALVKNLSIRVIDKEIEKEVLKIINDQVVLSNNDCPWRYAPEYAAKLITEMAVKNCCAPDVVRRSEQLVALLEFVEGYKMLEVGLDYEEIVRRFLTN